MSLEIRPIQHAEACKFINLYHRHNIAPQGCKWNIGCYNGDILVGVAITGRPVARYLDDGLTIEITRVCTDGTRNACSKLYGACVRIAKAMGYKKVITYILSSEDGASVKASNFVLAEKSAGGGVVELQRPRPSGLPNIANEFIRRNKAFYERGKTTL